MYSNIAVSTLKTTFLRPITNWGKIKSNIDCLFFCSNFVLDLSIPFEITIREPPNRFVCQLFKNVLTPQMKDILIAASQKLFSCVEQEKKINSRGEGVQLHSGFWKKHSKTKKAYKTKDSRNRKAWMEFNSATSSVWIKISQVIQQHLPEYYERMVTMKRHWRFPFSWGLWQMLAYNVNMPSKIHKDTFDDKDGICIIIPVGDFLGGDITLNEFNLDFQCLFGDILALSSAKYIHSNQKVSFGYRNSIVLFNTCECANAVFS